MSHFFSGVEGPRGGELICSPPMSTPCLQPCFIRGLLYSSHVRSPYQSACKDTILYHHGGVLSSEPHSSRYQQETLSVPRDLVLQLTAVHACVFIAHSYVLSNLAVCVDYRAQKLPGTSSSVHPHHAQDLQETKAPQDRGGEDVALASRRDHRY